MVGHGLIGIKLRRDNKEYIYIKGLNGALDITIVLEETVPGFINRKCQSF